jgi:maleamate amidohydrolase
MAKASEFENHCWKDVFGDELLEISTRYARDTYVGEDPALMLVDLYKFVYDGGDRPVREVEKEFSGSCGENAWKAIEPTKKLIAASRAASIPIIYITRHLDTGGIISTKSGKRRTRGPNAYDIWPDFAPQPGDSIIYKERASAFYGTPMIARLNSLGVRSLIICGESTSGCVRNTVQDAYMNGYQVSLVEECTFDRNILSHKVNLFDMHHKYADVMHVEEVVDHLDRLRRQTSLANLDRRAS